MKRGICIFLLYLILSLSLNSNIAFSQVNNPILREQSILSQCSVNAKSDSDTIKVVLRVAQENNVMVSLFPEESEGDIGQAQIVALTQIPFNNIYKFNYQNKEYVTESKILEDICYIDETDKTGQRASTQEETLHIEIGCESASANIPGDPSALTCSCYMNDQQTRDIRFLTHPTYIEALNYFRAANGRQYGACPEPKGWDIRIQTTVPETEVPPPPSPEIHEPEKCSDINDPTECDSSSLNCEWTGSRQNIPPECSGDALTGGLTSVFRFFTSIFGNILGFFLKIILFIPNLLGLDAQVADFATTVDCSQYQNQNSAWVGGSTNDITGRCEEKQCKDTDRNANYQDGKNYYYPGKLRQEEDNCLNIYTLSEVYCNEKGSPIRETYDCKNKNMLCLSGEVGSACYEVDISDLGKLKEATEKYQNTMKKIEEFSMKKKDIADMKKQSSSETDDWLTNRKITAANNIINQIKSQDLPRDILEARSYFVEYNNMVKNSLTTDPNNKELKKINLQLELEIAKMTSALALYEATMSMYESPLNEEGFLTIRPEQILYSEGEAVYVPNYYSSYGNIYSRNLYFEAYRSLLDIYNKIINSNLPENENNVLASDAITTRVALHIKLPDIFKTRNERLPVSENDKPRMAQILSSITLATELDPLNGRAIAIRKSIKYALLEGIESRLYEDVKYAQIHATDKFGLTSEQKDGFDNAIYLTEQFFLNTLNLFKAYASRELIIEDIGEIGEKSAVQLAGVGFIKTLEQRGGDISEYYNTKSRKGREDYVRKYFKYLPASEVADRIDVVLGYTSFKFEDRPDNLPPTENAANLNPDLILLAQNVRLNEWQLRVYSTRLEIGRDSNLMNIPNPDFRFLENKGYLTSEFFQRNWFDEFSDHINLIEVVLVLLPATQVSKTYTVSQYVSKVSGIAKVRYTIFTIQKARIPLGSLNLNPTFTTVSTVGKAFEFTLRGIQKGSEIAAQMSIGVGTDLSVTTYTNQYVGALFGNLIDLSPSKTARLVEKVIEKSPKTIADVGIKAGVKKEVAEIAAQRVVNEVLPKEMAENEGICTWFVKFLKEEYGSIDIPLTRSEPRALERCEQEVREGLEANVDEAYVGIKVTRATAPTVEISEAVARNVESARYTNPSFPYPGALDYNIANLPTNIDLLENIVHEEVEVIRSFDSRITKVSRAISDSEANKVKTIPRAVTKLEITIESSGEAQGWGLAHAIEGHIKEYSLNPTDDFLVKLNRMNEFRKKTLQEGLATTPSTRGATINRQYFYKINENKFNIVVIGSKEGSDLADFITQYTAPTNLPVDNEKSLLSSLTTSASKSDIPVFVVKNGDIIKKIVVVGEDHNRRFFVSVFINKRDSTKNIIKAVRTFDEVKTAINMPTSILTETSGNIDISGLTKLIKGQNTGSEGFSLNRIFPKDMNLDASAL